MSLNGILGVGRSGLLVHTLGVNVASHSAANVATRGFTRRTLALGPLAPPPRGGGGVEALGIRRVIDPFLERRLLLANADLGAGTSRTMALGILDPVFSEDAGGLGTALDDFEIAIADLSAHPGDPTARNQLLARADALATAIRRTASELRTAREEADDRIVLEVDELNAQLTEIARLGDEIARAEVGGHEASDLRDRRDELVHSVATRVPVTTVTGKDGRLTVLLAGGLPLVGPEGATPLSTTRDPMTGTTRIERRVAGATVDVTASVTSGTIGGLLAARDGALQDSLDRLDVFAFDLATAYNAVHQAGFGLDGVGGRNLFEPVAAGSGAAEAMALSSDVAGDPSAVAAAQDAGMLPGDNRNALALAALADTAIAVGGTRTAAEAIADLVATAGLSVQAASEAADRAEAVAVQVATMRDSVSGVSLDEEMVALMQYQRAYEASLRVVEVADQLLGELMKLGR